MKKRFKQLRSLSLLEWQLLITSALLLPLTALGLKLIGLKRTQQLMEKFSPNAPKTSLPVEQELQEGQMVAHMVSVAANHSIYRANCLKQSLVLWWLMRKRGLTAELRIGVKKEDCELNAHAWVELNGNVLIDNEKTINNFHPFI